MKKIFTLACMLFLTLACGITISCNKKTYLTKEEAKEIASEELGAFEFELEDFTECEMLQIEGLENKVYRLGASDGEMSFHDITIDGVTGDVYQCESESLNCGKYDDYEDKGYLSLDKVKQIIFNHLPGTNDYNIETCYFDFDDDEEKPFYYATIFTIDGVHDLTIDAFTGDIIEDYFKEDGDANADLEEFKEEFHDYLPETRFNDINGQRPVWLLAHHCNDDYYKNGTIKPDKKRDVYKGIKSGCNGVEIDLSHRKSDNKIILRHLPEIVAHAETLEQFLQLPEMNNNQMTMVLYDIKDYEYIDQMVEVTHEFYKKPENQNVYFIYSTDRLSNLKVKGYDDPYKRFRDIAPTLWPNEALEIDFENNQEQVRIMFDDIKFTRGIFGNGIFNGRARGNIEKSCKAAVTLRDKRGQDEDPYRFKAVESWTVGRLYNKNVFFFESVGLKERIEWGCDIVLLDGFKRLKESTFNTFYARELFKVSETVRLATRDDYPFGVRPTI